MLIPDYEHNENLKEIKRDAIMVLLEPFAYDCRAEQEVIEQALRFTKDIVEEVMKAVTVQMKEICYEDGYYEGKHEVIDTLKAIK